MKLVPVKQAQAKLFNAPADKGLKSLTLATFKKDRSLTLERDGEGWLLVEDGFEKSRSPLPPGAAGKRLLKEAFKREFPQRQRLFGRGSLTRAPRSVAEAPLKCTRSRVISVRSRR
ncbi:MAG: hypothetical protein ACLSGS_05760 [Adlercreutzia sp.]